MSVGVHIQPGSRVSKTETALYLHPELPVSEFDAVAKSCK